MLKKIHMLFSGVIIALLIYVDLLPAFEQYNGSDQIFFSADRHWTKTGNKIAASAVSPLLKTLLTTDAKQ